jgi:hypothetical protein
MDDGEMEFIEKLDVQIPSIEPTENVRPVW